MSSSACADVLGEMSTGLLQISLGLHVVEDVPWYATLAKRTGRPIIWQSVHHRWAEPDLWREQLDAVAQTFADGYRTYGITEAGLVNGRFTLKNVQTFDEFPTWKNVMFLPVEVKKQALREPETRARFREELATDTTDLLPSQVGVRLRPQGREAGERALRGQEHRADSSNARAGSAGCIPRPGP